MYHVETVRSGQNDGDVITRVIGSRLLKYFTDTIGRIIVITHQKKHKRRHKQSP